MGVDSSLTSIFSVSSLTGVETVKEGEETSPASVDTMLPAACGIGAGDEDEIFGGSFATSDLLCLAYSKTIRSSCSDVLQGA